MSGWQPTSALLRAALVATVGVLLAVSFGRPDLLVLAAPLLVHAALGFLRRPTSVPDYRSQVLHPTLREGEGTVARTSLSRAGDVEHAVLALARHRWWASRPASGVIGSGLLSGQEMVSLDLPVASVRWGRRPLGDGLVAATSPWGAHRWGPAEVSSTMVTTLPLPGAFDSRAPAPHPIGLVGTHPARRPGDGSELSSIRPFAPGDRLRRVQWRVSLRTGALHVTSSVAEEDSSLLLVVDSGVDLGESQGVRGRASTLDIAVRAAGAVAEHHLRRGDRVGLRVLGSTTLNAVRTGSGRRHLRRVLDTLARISPGERTDRHPGRLRFQVPAGAVVLVFSPMLSEQPLAATTALAAGGVSVIVVDTLPQDLDLSGEGPRDGPRDGWDGGSGTRRLALAWRLRRLERDALLARLERLGVPVVPWRGPGTLDEVLVRLGRRARRPSLARR